MTIAGQTFTVYQDPSPVPCLFFLDPTYAFISSAGGNGSVSVSAASSECSWTAAADQPWITVTGGSSGKGNGTVAYTVQPNSGAQRQQNMLIAGKLFYVRQDPNCTYELSPTYAFIPYQGVTDWYFQVTTSYPQCSWTVAAGNPYWLTIKEGYSSGSGSGRVYYSVTYNAYPNPQREQNIFFNGQGTLINFYVRQDPVP
jgi:hypothetical protein